MHTYTTPTLHTATLVARASSTLQQSQTSGATQNLPERIAAHMSIDELIQAYYVENERCCCGSPQDQRYAYELFRRALVEENQPAWKHICTEYAALVQLWVQRCGGIGGNSRRAWLVDAAFTRFQQSVTCFDTFSTLTALLHHLQFCAAYVVVDTARSSVQPQAALIDAHDQVELARAVGQ